MIAYRVDDGVKLIVFISIVNPTQLCLESLTSAAKQLALLE